MKFYLVHKNDKKSPIYVDVNLGKIRIRKSIGVTIEAKNWNENKQKVTSNCIDFGIINARIEQIRSNIGSLISELKILKTKVDTNSLNEKVNNILNPNSKANTVESKFELFDDVEKWLKYKQNHSKFKAKTIENYYTAFNHFKKFLTKYSIKLNSYNDFDESLFDDFSYYLRNDTGVSNSTIDTNLKNIKAFLNDKEKSGASVNPFRKELKLPIKSENDHIVLNKDDLHKIENYTPKDKDLQITKDLFFVQLHTAQRISDLKQIKAENIDRIKRIIYITQEKTGTKVQPPLTQKIEEILQKYDNRIPVMSNQNYNKNIKILLDKAGVNSLVEVKVTRGNITERKSLPKNELISSHSLRRTAITILLGKNLSISKVQLISGHKTISALQRYIKLSTQDVADEVRDLWDKY